MTASIISEHYRVSVSDYVSESEAEAEAEAEAEG
jgi:hypothetical protein